MDSLSPEQFNQYVTNQQRGRRSPSPSPRGRSSPIVMDNSCDVYNIPTPITSIPCQDLLEQKCTHCGWLRKRRSINFLNWPQAYVVLHEGCLYYFKNERARSPSGKFSLYGYSSVFRASEIQQKEAPWAFKIVHSHAEFKTYYFSASSEQEMKVWMIKVKNEMVNANGKSAIYGKNLQGPLKEEKPDPALFKDDASFYQDIETNIYDDSSKFQLTNDYQKKCSIKKNDEASDDEDLAIPVFNPEMDNRPPAPLPEMDPFVTLKTQSPLKPPRLPESVPPSRPHDTMYSVQSAHPARHPVKYPVTTDNAPPTPPRKRSNNTDQSDGATSSVQDLVKSLNTKVPNQQKGRLKRKPSYVKTDVGIPSPSPPADNVKVDHRAFFGSNSSGGGSTGEEDEDAEEYWASVYFDDPDKNRATDIIQALAEEGVYMVRPATNGEGKVLVVYACDQTKKYRIKKTDDDKYYLSDEGYKDELLENVLYYYYENNLPTVSVKLIQPYKLHPRYRSLQI